MEMVLYEWGGLLLRWVHIITGMAWVGSSFYFMHLDASLRPTPAIPAGRGGESRGGETWEVHGGGFYQVRKYLVAPDALPEELIWHKWQSYSTWLSGFCLLLWVYYAQSGLLLIDPAVRDLSRGAAFAVGMGGLAAGWLVYDGLCKSRLGRGDLALAAAGFVFVVFMAWFFQTMFSARGAYIHTGALMATMMSANVFFIIIPNQRKVIASLKAGETPDPALGKAAKQRSAHNNYLTLPVVFLMLSSHYPLSYSSPWAFAMVGLILVAGALVRVFYNERHAGRGNKWWAWAVAAVLVWAAISISAYTSPGFRDSFDLGALPQPAPGPVAGVVPAAVGQVIQTRCVMCHNPQPAWRGIDMPPKGVMLDTPGGILRNAHEVVVQAGLTRAMPPNNVTEMTATERRILRDWLQGRDRMPVPPAGPPMRSTGLEAGRSGVL